MSEQPSRSPAQHVLIVDDEEPLRRGLARCLRHHGYEVTEASCGPEALLAFDAARADVVLCDLIMPGMDGLAVLSAIRDRDTRVPVLLTTGMCAAETSDEAHALGAFGCLAKPIELGHLLAVMQQAVGARRIPTP